jgi:molybdopterin molybdotransferase
VRAGEILLAAGARLRPQDIGMLAAFGHAQVQVVRRPRAVILSTGDELVEPGEPLTPGKIRDANGAALAALVRLYGGEAIRLPIVRDTLADARLRFGEALALHPDLIISSAGVSVGAFDVVRAVLEELGTMHFWRINLRPGKPLAFGRLGMAGVPFFGLPGNPVSALVTFDVFVRPTLLRMGGQPDAVPTLTALTAAPITSDGRRSYLRVTLRREGGVWRAHLTGTQSSGALSSMLHADGLLIIPEGMRDVPAGTALPVRVLRESLYYTGDNPGEIG